MNLTAAQSRTIYIIGMGLLSAVLYSTMFFMMAFLLPVVLVFGRHGFRGMLQSAGVAVVAIFVAMLALAGGGGGLSGSLLAVSPAAALLAGILLLAWPELPVRNFVSRSLLAGLLSALMAIPAVYYMLESAEFSTLLDLVLQQTAAYVQLPQGLGESLPVVIKETMVNFFAVSFFLIVFVSAWLGTRFIRAAFLRGLVQPGKAFETVLTPEATKKFMAVGIAPLLPEYRVPVWYVWLLMAAWSLLLALRFFEINSVIVSAFAWNTALALSICYAVQGLAVLFVKILQTRMASAAGVMLPVLLLIVVVGGVTSMIVSAALALLGTLETWIPFRIPNQGDKP
ncbi:MAG: hypothetical protein KKC64_03635 [Spirochaetes bacterium]|nr:hypothetical protein [Spirochaetota bacterium]